MTGNRMRRLISYSLVSLAVAVLLAAAAFVGLQIYIHEYHRSPWQVVPDQISACGRDYIVPNTGHPQSLTSASQQEGAALTQVAATSGWFRTRPIFGHRNRSDPGTRCGTLVWLRIDASRFVAYGLSGGP